MSTPESARDRLLGAARVLFYNDGIAATGIDAIVKRAGVAKKASITISNPRLHWSRRTLKSVTMNGWSCTPCALKSQNTTGKSARRISGL